MEVWPPELPTPVPHTEAREQFGWPGLISGRPGRYDSGHEPTHIPPDVPRRRGGLGASRHRARAAQAGRDWRAVVFGARPDEGRCRRDARQDRGDRVQGGRVRGALRPGAKSRAGDARQERPDGAGVARRLGDGREQVARDARDRADSRPPVPDRSVGRRRRAQAARYLAEGRRSLQQGRPGVPDGRASSSPIISTASSSSRQRRSAASCPTTTSSRTPIRRS